MQSGKGGPFGAVVVRNGAVVGEGENRVLVTNDPTAHAEVVAIRNATAKLGHFSLAGATLYASSEPCPLCLAASYWARVDRVVYANDKSVASRAGFDDTFFYEELARPRAERTVPLEAVASSQFPTPALRAKNSALASARLERDFAITMPHWRNALRAYLAEKGYLPS